MNECNAEPCLNGGICQDKFNDYTCLCPPGSGWGGKNCDEGTFCSLKDYSQSIYKSNILVNSKDI